MLRRFILPGFLTLALAIVALPAQAATTGDLIKCPDFSSVYYLAEDGTRNVFPNENVYNSWYPNFNDVREISCKDMASVPIGELVDYQAGTRLVKTPFNPKVYAVEGNGILRAIQSEEQATTLYGANWADRVDDLPETFFTHYQVGTQLADGELPIGMIFVDDDGDLYRTLRDGSILEIDDVLGEQREELFERFATKLSDVERKLDELYNLQLTILDMKDDMQALFDEIMPMMRTVAAEAGFEAPTFTFDELYEREVAMQEYDDLNGDGIHDYWEEQDDYWKEHEVDDSWYANNYTTWVDDGYEEYYNDYYEVFEGELNFDQWHDQADQWQDFDYDRFKEEKWEHYDDWAYDPEGDGWQDYKTDWNEWQDYQTIWDESGIHTELPPAEYYYRDPTSGEEFYYDDPNDDYQAYDYGHTEQGTNEEYLYYYDKPEMSYDENQEYFYNPVELNETTDPTTYAPIPSEDGTTGEVTEYYTQPDDTSYIVEPVTSIGDYYEVPTTTYTEPTTTYTEPTTTYTEPTTTYTEPTTTYSEPTSTYTAPAPTADSGGGGSTGETY